MKRLTIANFAIALLLCVAGCNADLNTELNADSVGSLEQTVEAYLTSRFGFEEVKIDKVENVRIGNYHKVFEGREVFADYALQYKVNGESINRHGKSNGPATCYANIIDGKLECFTPEVVATMENNMHKALADGFVMEFKPLPELPRSR